MKKPHFLYIFKSSGISLFSYTFRRRMEKYFENLIAKLLISVNSKLLSEIIKEAPPENVHDQTLSIFQNQFQGKINFTEENIPYIPLNTSFQIMIANREGILGALIVEENDIDEEIKQFLDDLLNEFQNKYNGDALKSANETARYEDFEFEIERIFGKITIHPFQVPKLRNKQTAFHFCVDNEGFTDLVRLIDGKIDIKGLSEKLNMSIDDIKSMILKLLWNDIITISEKIFDEDIFEPKRDLFYLIRGMEIEPEVEKPNFSRLESIEFELLNAINGFKTILDLNEEFPDLSLHEIKHIISLYYSQDKYLRRVELYPQIIRISDEIRNKLPLEYLALSYSLENMCDGEDSLTEIAAKVDVPIIELKRVLDLLKDNVTFIKKVKK